MSPFIFLFLAILVIYFAGFIKKGFGDNNYHDVGQNRTSDNGNSAWSEAPVKSLYISNKLFSLHRKAEIVDDEGRMVYAVSSAILSFVDDTEIVDASGEQICRITRKLVSFHQRHYIQMHNGVEVSISKELFHPFSSIVNLEEIGWQLRGDMFSFSFEVCDEHGRLVAKIGQKPLSLRDKYSVDIYDSDSEELIVAIVIALKHMISDAADNSSASAGSGGNN